MSFINEKSKEINCKVVYYGPPLCGKSTSLRKIYEQVREEAKGDLISLSQDNDRTLYFDFVPLHLGNYKNYTIRLHLYTVPGEVGYDAARKLISKGVDGVVFIADSQLERMEANIKSMNNLRETLKHEGIDWKKIPMVFQYNKRDLPNAVPVEEIRRLLNLNSSEDFETVAVTGEGVFNVLCAIGTKVLQNLKKTSL
jgi:signal recognition particle receptor subunit beta